VFQAFRQVNRFGALLDTDYGRLLLIKIIVFLGLMIVAAVSRDIVNRRWRIPPEVLDAPEPVAAMAGAGAGTTTATATATATETTTTAPDWAVNAGLAGGGGVGDDEPELPEGYVLDEPTAERRMRRSLLLEVLISVVILAVTALLVNAAPARELDTGPYLALLNTKQLSFDVTVTPANRGSNEMHLFTLKPDGSTIDPTEVSAELSQPDNDIAPITVDLIRLAPGHYTSAGLTVPFAGDWKLTVKAVLDDVNEVSASATVPIHS
jgi:copper transport protein